MIKREMALGSENVFLRCFVIGDVEYGLDTSNHAVCSSAKEVIITDFKNFKYVKIKSARKENNRWHITDEDSNTHAFDIQRKLDNAYIIKEMRTDLPYMDMQRIIKDIADNGVEVYRVLGRIKGVRVISDIIKKMWQDDAGTYHAITKSENHYVWTIDQA